MAMVLNIKFLWMKQNYFMYNHNMKQQPRKKFSMIFLILGLAFLAIGISTDQTAFSWIAITFVLVSLVAGGKWMRPRR
jgi:cell division protein FtsW (lipid II flippase)